ncbi:MAG: SIR2 family protein [Kofleriaceae bacterium]|nr:SIR2 family protein [Candidatus Methylomirabilis lanthanidiphila]
MGDSPVLNLHNSLRQAKERWAVFLGAGASYDYGIPTMVEIAEILRGQIRDNKPDYGITKPTLDLLKTLCPEDQKILANWNIEDLLTRLSQLLDAAGTAHTAFAPVTTAIGKSEIPATAIRQASEELIGFMAEMCDLSSHKHSKHGSGNVDYLADFFLAMASFGKPANKLIRVFSTNIDLCVEAALVRLSQRPRADRRPDLVLVDGFESAILPTFNMGCYRREVSSFGERCAVYYWKLHGSVDWTYAQAIGADGSGEGEADYSDQSIIVRRVDGSLSDNLASCGALSAKQPDRSKRIVIFPTPAKYSQTYTVPYMDLFEAFRRTLEEIELLICIGTSFPDQHIRSAIRSFVERDNTLLFVVDPQVKSDNLKSLFGVSRSVQPVISMEFSQFVPEFKTLDAMPGTTKTTEGAQ